MNPDKNRLIRLAKLDDGSPISVGGLPMTDKLKFTDSIRNGIVDALHEYFWSEGEFRRHTEALDTLIECAEAVLKEANNQGDYDPVRHCKVIDDKVIERLREVLE